MLGNESEDVVEGTHRIGISRVRLVALLKDMGPLGFSLEQDVLGGLFLAGCLGNLSIEQLECYLSVVLGALAQALSRGERGMGFGHPLIDEVLGDQVLAPKHPIVKEAHPEHHEADGESDAQTT